MFGFRACNDVHGIKEKGQEFPFKGLMCKRCNCQVVVVVGVCWDLAWVGWRKDVKLQSIRREARNKLN